MFIIDEIRVLIQACKDVKERMPPENHRIHVDDIAATLQKLIDDEDARIDKMAEEYEVREQDRQDAAEVAANEMMEAAAAVMDWASQEKEMDDDTRRLQDWPGAL